MDREFLTLRSRLIDLAAILDRIDRAGDGSVTDPRLGEVRRSLDVLSDGNPDRVERVLRVFSLPYETSWQEQYGL